METSALGEDVDADTISAVRPFARTIQGSPGGSYKAAPPAKHRVDFFAGGGHETFNGAAGSGKEVMFGSTVVGGGAKDVFIGGSGKNSFELFGADATLTGGAGFNEFSFSNAGSTNAVVEIKGWHGGGPHNDDVFSLVNFSSNAVQATLATEVRSHGVTKLTLPDGTKLEILGAPKITAHDFIA